MMVGTVCSIPFHKLRPKTPNHYQQEKRAHREPLGHAALFLNIETMNETETKKYIHHVQVENIFKEGVQDDLLHGRIILSLGCACPLCLRRNDTHVGNVRIKKGPYGKFYACNRYPECKFSWNTPLIEEQENRQEHTQGDCLRNEISRKNNTQTSGVDKEEE